MKYRKKPVVVEAERFTQEHAESHLFDGAPLPTGVNVGSYQCNAEERTINFARFYVTTIQGQEVSVSPGEWIIAEGDGEHFYPCEPGIFEATYEPVEEDGS